MLNQIRKNLSIVVTLFVLSAVGCTSTPMPVQVSREKIIKKDQTTGNSLSTYLEKRLKFKHSPQVVGYLKSITQKLIDTTPQISGIPPIIRVIKDLDFQKRSFALPGNRIYLSLGALKLLEYENEVAAAISFQLGHLVNRDVLKKIVKQNQPNKQNVPIVDPKEDEENSTLSDEEFIKKFYLKRSLHIGSQTKFFEADGLLVFSVKSEVNASRTAVEILYHAGYDPRGMVTYLEKIQESIKNRKPRNSTSLNERQSLAVCIEAVRREIAKYPPIRNPIVSTPNFLMIKKSIGNL